MARLNFIFAQLLAAAISVGWIYLISFYVRGRVVLGHWPRLMIDDPEQTNPGVCFDLAGWAAHSIVFGIMALVVPVILAAVFGRDFRWRTMALAILVFAISAGLFYLSPVAFWYLD